MSGGPAPQEALPPYCALVVTFRRPDSLGEALKALLSQTHPPSLIVVADNDQAESARDAVTSLVQEPGPQLVYHPIGENLGPAGGWAAAWEVATRHPERGAWAGVFDDDDPLTDAGTMAEMCGELGDPQLGGLGLRGSEVLFRKARLQRRTAPVGESVAVDYLAGNGAPLYRCQALDECGFFDAELFFGFEDLDLGLRLGAHGWDVAAFSLARSQHAVLDTSPDRVPWREYYKTRAVVATFRRHLGVWPAFVHIVRSVFLGSTLLVLREHRVELAKARLLGAWDGLRYAMGKRRYDPLANPAKA